MIDTQTALIAHINSKANKYELKTVQAYAGEFDDVDALDAILPGVLVWFNDIQATKTYDRMRFSVFVAAETITYERETNLGLNMLLAWRVYNYLKNNPVFYDDTYAYVISVKEEYEPLEVDVNLITHRHCIVEISMTLWKQLKYV